MNPISPSEFIGGGWPVKISAIEGSNPFMTRFMTHVPWVLYNANATADKPRQKPTTRDLSTLTIIDLANPHVSQSESPNKALP